MYINSGNEREREIRPGLVTPLSLYNYQAHTLRYNWWSKNKEDTFVYMEGDI